MRGITVERISGDKKREMNIPEEPADTAEWSTWECGPSAFDWHYSDTEVAYVYEGRVVVRTAGGEEIEVRAGDLVTFPEGLDCTWQVKEKIKKVYCFR